MTSGRLLRLAGLLASVISAGISARGQEGIVFDRDVRPILAEKCFSCHGPDGEETESGLRLDTRLHATGDRGGPAAIVPGDPAHSELVRRVESSEPDECMPPPESRKRLSAAEIEILRRWIAAGADYAEHWAFVPPQRPAPPAIKRAAWVRNPIDAFVLEKLEQRGAEPAAEAGRETIIRRVSLDVRGLPPTPAEIDCFLDDEAPGAYERMVERMLASPHFGEKMAIQWLDLARHGDTSGFHFDSTRDTWPWRDWVIAAYNANLPFDRFSLEQLAGDLLPGATFEQRIASGFNRNCRFNEEGGADPEEWLVRYAVDRTVTLGRIWLGLTLECAECHGHKYDPVSQREFYELYAFFNSLEEVGAGGMTGFHEKPVPPVLRVPLKDREQHAAALAELEAEAAAIMASVAYEDPGAEGPFEPVEEWLIDDAPPPGARLKGDSPWRFIEAAEGPVFRGERAMVREAEGFSQHSCKAASTPLEIGPDDVLVAHVFLDPANPPRQIMLQWHEAASGWNHRAYWGENLATFGVDGTPSRLHRGPLPEQGRWIRLEVPARNVGLRAGARVDGMAFAQFGGRVFWDAAGLRRAPDPALRSLAAWSGRAGDDDQVPLIIRSALAKPATDRTRTDDDLIRRHYLQHICIDTRGVFAPLNARFAALEAAPGAWQPVSMELPRPRPAFVLVRGDFQQPAEQVSRNVPAILPPLPDGPRDRAALARWLFDPAHPLTARVAVNRLWAQVFGRGLVESLGDFGRLGRYPSHPELLDWLAVEFRESGWDTKHMLRLILASSTYRQAPVGRPATIERDPDNLLLGRSPRYRLAAEEIRDAALRASGLLAERIGGPPAYPTQPSGYYAGKQGKWTWPDDAGEDRHRRGLYTFWRRTTPYPTFVIFDAPDRGECVCQRPRTNTPLQALATLNDPQFIEAARALARSLVAEGPDEPDPRLALAFRRAVARPPTAPERAVLHDFLSRRLAHYRAHPAEAAALAGVGADGDAAVEIAAWTNVANALFNLDEFITRE